MKTNLQSCKSLRGFYSLVCLLLVSITTTKAEKIALFYNTTYIQISEGNLFAEGSNLRLSLEEAGHEVTIFSGLESTAWEAVIATNDLIIIPELERENLYQNLAQETKNTLQHYIQNGGGLIICGVVAPNEANSNNAIELLNGVFDFSLEADAVALSGASSKIDNQVAGTHYVSCLSTVGNNNSISFLTSELPSGSKQIYQDATNSDNTTVALLPYQSGRIAYLGWGWWNAAPLGSQDNGWMDILDASIKEVACTAPVAAAKSSFTLELNSLETSLDANLLDNGSYTCGTSIFSVEPSTFTCDNIGTQMVTFTVADQNGRQSSATLTVEITDPNNVCYVATTATINGQIETFEGQKVQGVNLELLGANNGAALSTANGSFTFENALLNSAYEVIPSKNDNPLNGVSSYDLILMSRHILDIESLDSPYKIIAADVDNSGTVTTADIIELRSLILYQQTEFSNNDSWRFIQKGYVFENPTNPLNELLPSNTFIASLSNDMNVNFVGVKIGDVNGSAIANLQGETDNRNSAESLPLSLESTANGAAITLDKATSLMGFQMTLSFDSNNIEDLDIATAAFSNTDFKVNIDNEAGLVHISCAAKNAQQFTAGTVLFTSNHADLTVNNRYLNAEAYINTNEITTLNIHTVSNQQAATSLEVAQNQPNPFTTHTEFAFELETAGNITLLVHNMAGQEVYSITNKFAEGANKITLNANDLVGSGVFVYTLQTPTQSVSKRMVKL